MGLSTAVRLQGVCFAEASAVKGWQAIDDRVMGGVSRSQLRHDPAGHAVFEGWVSAEQGGGFASVRHAALLLGAADTTAYGLDVRGDGNRYKLNLRTAQTFDGLNYQAQWMVPAHQWVSVRLPVSAFRPMYRGREVADAPPLMPEQVQQVGLMIADQQWGPFALCIRRLYAVPGFRKE